MNRSEDTLARILELDAAISRRLRVAERPGVLRSIATVLAHSGDSWFWLLALALLAIWGDGFWQARARFLIVAILTTAVVVMTIKFTVRRRRPEGEWGAIYRSTDPHSFPSGHAARAIMLGVAALVIGPPWLGATVVIWAPLVALARVAMGVHFLSDVLAGGLLGALMAWVNLFLLQGLFALS